MAVVRQYPGDIAPWSGVYALVGHYGEPTNFAVICEAGERLPMVTITGDYGPVWFVHVDQTNQAAAVA